MSMSFQLLRTNLRTDLLLDNVQLKVDSVVIIYKSEQTKIMQWNAFDDKKTDDKCDPRYDTQRNI